MISMLRLPCCLSRSCTELVGRRLTPNRRLPSRWKLQGRSYARRRGPNTFAFDAQSQRATPKTNRPTRDDDLGEAKELGVSVLRRLKRVFAPKRVLIGTLALGGLYYIYTLQTDPSRSPILNPKHFSPFILESRTSLTPTSTASLLHLLSVPAGQNTAHVSAAWRTGVWSLQVMQPDLQIARSYTPLPPSIDPTEGGSDYQPESLRLLVRAIPPDLAGEVSSFLHRISPGTLVHMRGPQVEFFLPDDLDEVVFLAGGTGVAPALQTAYCLFWARPRQEGGGHKLPRMKILWANRRRDESKVGRGGEEVDGDERLHDWRNQLWKRIRSNTATATVPETEQTAQRELQQTQIVKELDRLVASSDGRLSVDYFVDEDGSFITDETLKSALADKLASGPSVKKRKLILVSGPDGFVAHYAGPKEWRGGKEVPGPLGGVLGRVKPASWEIWSL